MLEESQHLARCIGPLWIGERSGAAAAGPGVAGTVNGPVLHDGQSIAIRMDDALAMAPTCNACDFRALQRAPLDFKLRDGILDDAPAISMHHSAVDVTMEDNSRDGTRAL